MIVTIEYNQVAVEDRQNKNVEHCVHIFTRQEFENITECSLSDYESASYEPNRNIFITTNRDNVIESYKSANENEILKAIEDKKDLIIFETEKALLQNKIFENGVWIDKPKSKEELDTERIAAIKVKAGEIINNKYSIYWQLNHPRLDESYIKEYQWIDNIRAISNKAETNGTALEDIDWQI